MTIDYNQAREMMVEQQVRPWDVLDARVLGVLATLPREKFVPEIHRALAYADVEIPLGHGQKMMKPVVEGRTLQALLLQDGDEVLEIGTGGGYLAACMGALAREVVSLEIQPELEARARQQLDASVLGQRAHRERGRAALRHRPPLRRHLRHRCGHRDPVTFPAVAASRWTPVRRTRPLAGDGSGAGAQRSQRSAHRIVV